jgi:hypothetical protein
MRTDAIFTLSVFLEAVAASLAIKDVLPKREVTGLTNGTFSVPVYRRAGKVGRRAITAEYPMTPGYVA